MERFTKPGTANVSPADRTKLAPLLAHYAKMAHPFTACYRDQIKHGLSKDHAARRCAVLKDLIVGSTSWRKGKRAKNLAELRDAVLYLDLSGADCEQLKRARRVLQLAEQRESIDMATISEDDPRLNWRTMGNGKRGVILKGGKRVVVTAAQFDRLKAAGKIDPKTPRLKGDSPNDAKTATSPTPASASKTAGPLINHLITRGPRKGRVVQGRIVNGKFYEVTIKTNTEKGNPRAGRKYVETKDAKGRKVHVYRINGKNVPIVVK